MEKEAEINDVLIAVPSKGRADVLHNRTAQVLEDFEYEVFVEPQEADEYSEWNPQVLAKNDQGICYVMAKIKEYAQANNYDYVLKVDDDVEELNVDKLLDEAKFLSDNYENVGAVSCTRNNADNYRFMFVDHPLESVFVIRTELMTETKKKGLHHDAAQTLKIWDEEYQIVQTGVNLKNDVGRSNDIKPDDYESKVNRFIPLSSGTKQELNKELCKTS